MTENIQKPYMYLDQNALDQLRKKGTEAHFLALKDVYTFVYSSSTLREIHKAGVNANDVNKTVDFLGVLTQLEALYLQLPNTYCDLNAQPNVTSDKPYNIYTRFIDEILRFDEFTHPMEIMGLAIYNGIKHYDEFSNSQINAMSVLKKFLLDNLAEITHEIENLHDERAKLHLELYVNQKLQQIESFEAEFDDFKNNVNFTSEKFKEANQDQSIVKTIREIYCINIDNLKKIEGFNALNRIFDYLDEVKPEDFPSLKVVFNNAFAENENISNRISLIYDFLNLIGYYPDEFLNKENKFLRSSLDRSHAMIGCFCDIFVTHDQRFIKKMKVIYEHFNIATEIYGIEVLKDQTIFKVIYGSKGNSI